MSSFFFNKWKEIQTWFKEAVLKKSVLSSKKPLTHPKCRILCVDDDRSFCFFMQRLAYSKEIQLDIAGSIQEAKIAIEQNPQYQAFIIDGHLPDGSGFELAAWIREKKEIALPIGFVSRIYHDAASFRILKESLKVNYVLEKPMSPEEVNQLLTQITNLITSKSAVQEAFSEELLAELKKSYQSTILDKVERLEKMILDVQKNPMLENIQTLRNEVHKIAGSAGSYGYMGVSELCKHLEVELIKQIDLAKRGQTQKEWLNALDDFFTQIKLHFQMQFPEKNSLSFLKSGSVYVIDEDPEFLKEFAHSIQNLNFDILTETHPDNAIQGLLSSDFYPQIVFVDSHYHSSGLSGLDIVKKYSQHNDYLTSNIALMVDAKALEDQIEAFKNGMWVVVDKPFNPSSLIALLDQIPFRPFFFPFKILAVDDDQDIGQFITQGLKFTGLQISNLLDMADLEKTLKIEQPDLILLDINLADDAHLGTLQRLRNEWNYQNLLVGMLTLSQQDTHLLQKCYEANVDEILFKPLEVGVLQRKVSFLLKKRVENILFKQSKIDDKHNLLSEAHFKRYLDEFLKPSQLAILKMLVLVEITGLNEIHPKVREEIVEHISQSMDGLFNKYEAAAQLDDGSFAFLFHGIDPHFVQLFMHRFLQQISLYLNSNYKRDAFAIHEALVLLSEGEKSDGFLKKSRKFLEESGQRDETISMNIDPDYRPSREVFVLQETLQSLNYLPSLFQTHHFKLSSLPNLGKLPVFKPCAPLFILMSSFVDAKELQAFKSIFTENQIQIPLLQLSHVPDETYLENFLKGINYFDSPFGLMIIIHNAMGSEIAKNDQPLSDL